ncbi:hypothetical protein [Hyalangium sp.]|uniref:hypothetical protein n=1 Tax=Hyalangium sp. TaxID=2028555 RepID=UPI002D6116AA|nr:hypothetical protein [Hyalangium sp.]HYH97292.1 hypothetical protein [Hyalangium sp.]
MKSCVVRWSLSLGVVMVLSGCAAARHREALYDQANRHVYAQPIEKVWPQVVKLVAAEGYPPRNGNDEFILVTEWRNDMMESRVVSSASRLYAEGYRVDSNTSLVRVFRQTIFTGNKGMMNARENSLTSSMTVAAAGDINPFAEDPIKMNQFLGTSADHTPLTRAPAQLTRSFSRDGELEWKLLQFVDGQAAQAIEAHITQQENK